MQNDFIKLKQKEFAELKEYINSVKNVQGLLMQTLQKAQDIFGYLPLEVQQFISDETNMRNSICHGLRDRHGL